MIRFFCLKHFATLKHNGNVRGTGIFHKTWKRDLFSFFPHMENQLSSDHLMNNPFFTTDLQCQLCNILGFNICVGLSGLSFFSLVYLSSHEPLPYYLVTQDTFALQKCLGNGTSCSSMQILESVCQVTQKTLLKFWFKSVLNL